MPRSHGIDIFRQQINAADRDPDLFLTAHLMGGICHILPDEARYAALKHTVATTLSHPPHSGVHTSKLTQLTADSVLVVGSGKLGYSLNPRKDFSYFSIEAGSDLDIAIISNSLFEHSLDDIRQQKLYKVLNRSMLGKTITQEVYSQVYLLRSILYGFIPLDGILPSMSYGPTWSKATEKIVHELGPGFENVEVNFRLYRDISFLREYQYRAVSKAITRLDEKDLK